jgi:hypothetical protein
MHLIKPGLQHQDLEGIHLPSFRFSWKLKKVCRVVVKTEVGQINVLQMKNM